MLQFSNFIAGQEWIFLIITVIIAVVVINAVRKRKTQNIKVKDDPIDDVSTVKKEQNVRSLKILRERLAKGEITQKEYDSLKKEFE